MVAINTSRKLVNIKELAASQSLNYRDYVDFPLATLIPSQVETQAKECNLLFVFLPFLPLWDDDLKAETMNYEKRTPA